MGKIRVVNAMTNSMQDIVVARAPTGIRVPAGVRPFLRPATNVAMGMRYFGEFNQTPDSSRSRGYGRYEI